MQSDESLLGKREFGHEGEGRSDVPLPLAKKSARTFGIDYVPVLEMLERESKLKCGERTWFEYGGKKYPLDFGAVEFDEYCGLFGCVSLISGLIERDKSRGFTVEIDQKLSRIGVNVIKCNATLVLLRYTNLKKIDFWVKMVRNACPGSKVIFHDNGYENFTGLTVRDILEANIIITNSNCFEEKFSEQKYINSYINGGKWKVLFDESINKDFTQILEFKSPPVCFFSWSRCLQFVESKNSRPPMVHSDNIWTLFGYFNNFDKDMKSELYSRLCGIKDLDRRSLTANKAELANFCQLVENVCLVDATQLHSEDYEIVVHKIATFRTPQESNLVTNKGGLPQFPISFSGRHYVEECVESNSAEKGSGVVSTHVRSIMSKVDFINQSLSKRKNDKDELEFCAKAGECTKGFSKLLDGCTKHLSELYSAGLYGKSNPLKFTFSARGESHFECSVELLGDDFIFRDTISRGFMVRVKPLFDTTRTEPMDGYWFCLGYCDSTGVFELKCEPSINSLRLMITILGFSVGIGANPGTDLVLRTVTEIIRRELPTESGGELCARLITIQTILADLRNSYVPILNDYSKWGCGYGFSSIQNLYIGEPLTEAAVLLTRGSVAYPARATINGSCAMLSILVMTAISKGQKWYTKRISEILEGNEEDSESATLTTSTNVISNLADRDEFEPFTCGTCLKECEGMCRILVCGHIVCKGCSSASNQVAQRVRGDDEYWDNLLRTPAAFCDQCGILTRFKTEIWCDTIAQSKMAADECLRKEIPSDYWLTVYPWVQTKEGYISWSLCGKIHAIFHLFELFKNSRTMVILPTRDHLEDFRHLHYLNIRKMLEQSNDPNKGSESNESSESNDKDLIANSGTIYCDLIDHLALTAPNAETSLISDIVISLDRFKSGYKFEQIQKIICPQEILDSVNSWARHSIMNFDNSQIEIYSVEYV